MSAGYRVRQFVRALSARLSQAEQAWIDAQLHAPARRLFDGMPHQDQRHGLDVAQALQVAGETDPQMWIAALLHDAGKADAGLTVFHRTLVVVLRAVRPAWLVALSASERGWRRPFWRQSQHAARGAEQAAKAGCSERTVWLIRHHHTPAGDLPADAEARRQLECLQRADSAH